MEEKIRPLSSEEKEEIKRNIYKHIQLPATSGRIWFFPGGRNNWLPRTVAAAVLLGVLTASLYIFLKPTDKIKTANSNMYAGRNEISAGPGEMKKITLADGTLVILNANSILRYGHDFRQGYSRKVEVEGNAFFSVKKNSQAPFVVRAGALNVTVLGTQLNVNARSGEIKVELASGKVKVEHEGNGQPAAYLQPGEQLKLDTAKNIFSTRKINPGLYDAWTKGQWNFHQNTLEEITDLIREFYGVDILFTNEAARKSRIDAVLPVAGLQNIVSVIEHTLQIHIQVNNNQLIVN